MNMQLAEYVGVPKQIRDATAFSIKAGFYKEVENKYEHINGFSYYGKEIVVFGKEIKILIIAIPFELMQKEFVYVFDVKNIDLLSYAMKENGEKLSKDEREKYIDYVIETIDSMIEPVFADAHSKAAKERNEVN